MKHNKNDIESMAGVETYSLETKEVGDKSDNSAKIKLAQYYDYYQNSIIMITSNVDLIKTMHDNAENIQVLYECSPFFIQNAYINAWHSIVVKMCRLLCKKEETSLNHFLSFIEQKEKELFTTEHYQRWIPSGQEDIADNEIGWEKVERPNLKVLLEEDRKKIQDCQSDVEKVKRIRDKVFAHMDKEMLDSKKQNECLGGVTIELLEKLAKIAGDIFNSIYYYDKNSSFHFHLMNNDDVLNLSYRCKWYEDHKEDIVKMQLGLPLKAL